MKISRRQAYLRGVGMGALFVVALTILKLHEPLIIIIGALLTIVAWTYADVLEKSRRQEQHELAERLKN